MPLNNVVLFSDTLEGIYPEFPPKVLSEKIKAADFSYTILCGKDVMREQKSTQLIEAFTDVL